MLAKTTLLALTGTLALSSAAHAATLRVDSRATGFANGSSWNSAYPNLQDALAAATAGDEIWIAKGVYYPDEGVGYTDNDRSHSFVIPDDIIIIGGFAGWEDTSGQRSPDVLRTVLSGDIEQNDIDEDGNGIAETSGQIVGSNALHVVTSTAATSDSFLVDVTITAGCADSGADTHGGGMYLLNASPRVNGVRFLGNRCTGRGGAMHVDGGSPYVDRCTFSGNTANARGGAVGTLNSASPEFISCVFKGNFAARGGGLNFNASTPVLTNCTVSGNRGLLNGGGIQCAASAVVTIENTIVWNNSAAGVTTSAGASINLLSSSTASYTHSILQNLDLSATGTNNLDGTDPLNDPLFEEPAPPASAPGTFGILRLERGTPLAELGDATLISGGQDIDFGARVSDSDRDGTATPDLGAYELGRISYVDDTATGAGDGSSWADAFPALFDALGTLNVGDEVHVAEGVYYPDEGAFATDGNRFSVFQLTTGVQILGGFENGGGDRDPHLYVTILSGDIDQDDDSDLDVTRSVDAINGENSYHVVRVPTGAPGAVIDGFTITGGQANFTTAGHIHQKGGGVWFQGSGTVRNCHFIGNYAEDEGGAGYFDYSAGLFDNCRFTHNFANDDGGAVYVESSMPRVVGCDFIENISQDDGGAMLINDALPVITDTCFRSNVATFTPAGDGAAGGAIFIRGASPVFQRCAFVGNSASTYQGGAIFSRSGSSVAEPVWEDCVFSGNHAHTGGAFFFILSQAPTIANCTLTGNHATSSGGAMHVNSGGNVTITNTIFHNNMENGFANVPEATKNGFGTPTYRHCIVANSGGSGSWNSTLGTDLGGNLDIDPLLLEPVDPADAPTPWGDARPLPGSPAVDVGDNAEQPGDSDIAGAPRIHGTTIDIGAFEQGDLIHVEDNVGGGGPFDGTSWATAFHDLQDGIAASTTGDLILVGEGVHRPDFGAGQIDNDPASTYQLVDGTALLGGYQNGGTGVRDPDLYQTILTGDIDKNDTVALPDIVLHPNDIVGDNANHVVTTTGAGKFTRLDGFTITGGEADQPGVAENGGGLYSFRGAATIADCKFIGNACSREGAAVWDGDSLSITDTQFISGVADRHGGGIYTFTSASTRLLRCSFRSNFGSIGSGGMHTHLHSRAHLSNCEFVGNHSARGGGFDNDSGSPTLVNCTFTGNRANVQGGAIINWQGPSSTFINCVIWNNDEVGSTSTLGASINRRSSELPTFINCLVANTGGSGVGFAGGDLADGGGNIDTDPFFILPGDPSTAPNAMGDVRLAVGSPAIDAGLNSASDSPTDLALSPRIQNGTIDMGAFEGEVLDDDTDDDGIPDYWERSFDVAGSPVDLDPDGDTDGDGLTAMEEFFFGLDPTATNDTEEHSALGNTGSFLTISFPMNPAADPYLDFVVERSTDLGVTDDWDPETLMSGVSGDWMTYRSTFAMPQAREFLRVSISPKP